MIGEEAESPHPPSSKNKMLYPGKFVGTATTLFFVEICLLGCLTHRTTQGYTLPFSIIQDVDDHVVNLVCFDSVKFSLRACILEYWLLASCKTHAKVHSAFLSSLLTGQIAQ